MNSSETEHNFAENSPSPSSMANIYTHKYFY